MSEKFRTVYDRSRSISNSGSPMANDYALKYDEDGRACLEIVGEHNLDDEIQMYRDVTDIEKIVERFINLGDISILNKKPTFYGDITQMPETYAELLQFNADVERNFYDLPVEIRQQFGNDLGQFIASIGSKKFFDILNPVFGVEDPNKESEVKPDVE